MANENSTPKPPPWFFFNPSDTRVIQTFLIPRIRQQDLPLNDFSQRDLFASLPWLLAGREGYSEEKPEIYFFNQQSRMTPQWIPVYNSEVLIRRGDTVIGRKDKFRHASNSSDSEVQWYLDEYTAEGENSDEAVYKLYTGINPAVELYPAEARNLNITVPPPQSGSSSLPVHPNPPPQQASSQWNPLLLQHSGSSSLLQQASLPWNTASLQASSQRNPSQLGLNESSALPLPQGNLTFLQQDDTQTGLHTDWSESEYYFLQQILNRDQPTDPNLNFHYGSSSHAPEWNPALEHNGFSSLPLPQGNLTFLQQDNTQTGLHTDWSESDYLLQQTLNRDQPTDPNLNFHYGSSSLTPEWNPTLEHSGFSSLPPPQGNSPFLQQDNTQTGLLTDWSESGLPQQVVYSNPQPTNQNPNALPQGNPPFLQQDNAQTGFHTDWSGSGLLQEVVYSNQLTDQNPNALPQGNPPSPQQDNAQTGVPAVQYSDNQPTNQNPHPGL